MGDAEKRKLALAKTAEQKRDPSKPGTGSSHTVQATAKRRIEDVANSSAEELVLLSSQMEHITEELKQMNNNVNGLKKKTEEMMTKTDMKDFIKSTVEEIMIEINKNIEVTMEIKITEKTDSMKKEIEQLKRDAESLRKENSKLKKDLGDAQKHNAEIETIAKQALQKANQNEQYSRKNNVKIQNIEEKTEEDEISLLNTVGSMLQAQGVDIRPESVIAIHRIPGKSGAPKPVLIKFRNNNDKTKVMKQRAGMKAAGHRLVDDVTKLNTTLISDLNDHALVEVAWYFNGSVYGKTKSGKRLKFELYDDIDSVIAKAEAKK